MKRLFQFVLFLAVTLPASGQVINAATCSAANVQTAINTATEGQTVTIPAGTCAWTSGVTISGKGITVQGAGSGRIIAISASTLTIGTGSKTLTVTGADPGHTLAISNGASLTITETGTPTNVLSGTVTSYSAGTLVMNITSASGSCTITGTTNCKRWLVSTPSTTVITNNMTGGGGSGASSSNTLFWITEDTTVHTNVSGFKIAAGTGAANGFGIAYASGGQAVLLHDFWVEINPAGSGHPANAVNIFDNKGVVWNASFDVVTWDQNTGMVGQLDPSENTIASWNSASTFGAADTTGQGNIYIEDSDFHLGLYCTNTNDNGRMVVRYSMYDNCGHGTHGPDTAPVGQRYFESYNNVGVFEGYNDGTTFNMQGWFLIRGGTFAVHDNAFTLITSTDYGAKPGLNMEANNVYDNNGGSGPNPCWGAFFSSGAKYHYPRQVGFGYVTGSGTASYTGASPNPIYTVSGSTDSHTYVGDSEPAYSWNNSPSLTTLIPTSGEQNNCSSPDSAANYIVSGRDYFNGSTAKPGYTPYTYPHPLESGSGAPAAPTGLTAVIYW